MKKLTPLTLIGPEHKILAVMNAVDKGRPHHRMIALECADTLSTTLFQRQHRPQLLATFDAMIDRFGGDNKRRRDRKRGQKNYWNNREQARINRARRALTQPDEPATNQADPGAVTMGQAHESPAEQSGRSVNAGSDEPDRKTLNVPDGAGPQAEAPPPVVAEHPEAASALAK